MRKFMNIFAAVLVMLAAVSCEKNETLPDNNSEGKVVTLKASINNGETKASLGNKSGETYPVLWSEGDEIAVAQVVGSDVRVYKFTLTAGEGYPNGTFTCYNAVGFDPSLGATVALYPYTSQLDFLVVQTNQNYAEKSFDSDAILMMALMEEGSLKFNNLLGILKLTIKGAPNETVSSIELTANKPISGNAQFNGTLEGVFIVTEGEDADYKNNIVLNCPNVAIDTEKEFLITVPAGTYDFAVTINTNKGTYYKSTTNKSIEESMILNMQALDLTEFENSMPYVENGVYLGEGVELPAGEGKTIIWAPVNCGYDDDHKYGLLYQWGRKYGQTYDGETPEVQIIKNTLSDAANGSSEDSKNKYFFGNVSTEDGGIEGVYYWLFPKATGLWNSNTETNPIKTAYDPCPEGWRVPTIAEMETLSEPQGQRDESDDHHRPPMGGSTIYYEGVWSTVGTDNDKHAGLTGCYFYGSTSEKTGSKVFFPAAGYRTFDSYGNSSAQLRSLSGNYWSSTTADSNEDHSKIISFYNSGRTRSDSGSRVNGYSVRCVKE